MCDPSTPTGAFGCGVEIVGGAVQDAVFGDMGKVFLDGFDFLLKEFMTSWLSAGMLVDLDGVSVDWFKTSLSIFTVFLTTLGLMVAGVRTLFMQKGQPIAEAARGFGTVIGVSLVGTVLVQMCVAGGAAYAKWILDTSGAGVDQYGIQSTILLANPGVAIIAGLLGIIAVVIQWGIMLGRNAILPFLVAFWPTAAAGAMIGGGKSMFTRLTTWILAFILYVPLAASIYAFAWKLKSGVDGVGGVINGIILLLLAIFTLPALLRLMAPASSALGNAAGGAMALGVTSAAVGAGIAAGAAVATGGGSAAAGTANTANTASTTSTTSTAETSTAGGGDATGTAGGSSKDQSSPPSGGSNGGESSSDASSAVSGGSSSDGTSGASGGSSSGPSGDGAISADAAGGGSSSSSSPSGGAGGSSGSESGSDGGSAAGGGSADAAGGGSGASGGSGSGAGTGTRAAWAAAESVIETADGSSDGEPGKGVVGG